MNLQTLQDFLKVLSIFLEFLQAMKSPQSFRIFFYDFTNTQDFQKVLIIFQEFLQAIKCPQSFRISFYEFTNTPGFPEGAKYFSRISRIFSLNLETLQDFLKMLSIFLEFLQAIKSPLGLKIQAFTNIPGLPEGAKNFSRISTCHKNPQSLKIIFMNLLTLQDFLKLLSILLEFLQAIKSPLSLKMLL